MNQIWGGVTIEFLHVQTHILVSASLGGFDFDSMVWPDTMHSNAFHYTNFLFLVLAFLEYGSMTLNLAASNAVGMTLGYSSKSVLP